MDVSNNVIAVLRIELSALSVARNRHQADCLGAWRGKSRIRPHHVRHALSQRHGGAIGERPRTRHSVGEPSQLVGGSPWRCWQSLLVSTPAAAQSGSEAVVCVGSENRIHQGNPIRRFYTEDMEVMYRIGVDIGERNQIERTLGSELGPYPEVWCAWSDPGDDHVVIVGYTGVIRQDLTVDPEDPRFQAFSVGFGTDFDAAEMQATTINQRFSSQSDGSGYEVLLREMWGVAQGVVEAVGVPEPNGPDGPICTGRASPEGCWMEISNHPLCYLWNEAPQDNVTVTWNGDCSDGFAQGRGEETWYQNGALSQTNVGSYRAGQSDGFWVIRTSDGSQSEGPYVNGERDGTWTIYWAEGDVGREVGPYVNGERHGTWTGYDQSGNRLGTIRYENGQRVGGSESALEAVAAATLTPPQLSSPATRSPPRRAVVTPRHQRSAEEPAWREAAWE